MEEKEKKKQFRMIVLFLIVSILVTGCKRNEGGKNSEPDSNVQTGESNKEGNSDVITVTDGKGEVAIPRNPKRIVDVSGNSDILSILGYQVIGTANSDAYDYTKFPSYLEETLKDAKILGYSMQDTVDVEGIISLEPDLIIISNVQEKMYQQLSNIAPTVMLLLEQLDWKEDVKNVAAIFHQEEKAENWLNQYKERAEEEGERIRNQYGEKTTYLSLLASGGQIFVFDKAGIGGILYDDMELERPKNMPVQENISLPVISPEGLAAMEADYIFLIGTDEDIKGLKENPVWSHLKAVQENRVYEMPASPYFNQGYSCIGRYQLLGEIGKWMEKIHE